MDAETTYALKVETYAIVIFISERMLNLIKILHAEIARDVVEELGGKAHTKVLKYQLFARAPLKSFLLEKSIINNVSLKEIKYYSYLPKNE